MRSEVIGGGLRASRSLVERNKDNGLFKMTESTKQGK